MENINNKLQFQETEFKKGEQHFYIYRKIFGIFSYKKEIFSIVISYRGGDIEVENMYQQSLIYKKIGIYKNISFERQDIEKLAEYLSTKKNLPISKNEININWKFALFNLLIQEGIIKINNKSKVQECSESLFGM